MIDYNGAIDPDKSVVSVWDNGVMKFVWELQPGEDWTLHPDGGIIVTHPERKPLRIWVDHAGAYRQDWIDAS